MNKWVVNALRVAHVVATLHTCDRLAVGAVLLQNNHIISTGYNGAASGQPDCDHVGHAMVDGHCVRAVHAEENALLHANPHGKEGLTLVCTHMPCVACCLRAINYGVRAVVYDLTSAEYRDHRLDSLGYVSRTELLARSNVMVRGIRMEYL